MTELHIVSDGTGTSTYITTPTGEKLEAVRAVVTLEAGSVNTVDLELWMPSVNIKVISPQTILFFCPCCGESLTHPCKGV